MIIRAHSYSRERPRGKVLIPTDTQHTNPTQNKGFPGPEPFLSLELTWHFPITADMNQNHYLNLCLKRFCWWILLNLVAMEKKGGEWLHMDRKTVLPFTVSKKNFPSLPCKVILVTEIITLTCGQVLSTISRTVFYMWSRQFRWSYSVIVKHLQLYLYVCIFINLPITSDLGRQKLSIKQSM